jgi:hypothetical protein
MKSKLNKKAQKSYDNWSAVAPKPDVYRAGPILPYKTARKQNNARFNEAIKYGEEWEMHVGKRLSNKYHGYEVKHVSDILPAGQYRLNNNKYPDFTLYDYNKMRMILIDAKRKKGYDPRDGRQYVTMDETYIDAYQNIQKHYEDQGWTVSGKIYFFVERKMDLYVANDFQPHHWQKFNNQYGKNTVGIYYLDQMGTDTKVLKGWVGQQHLKVLPF